MAQPRDERWHVGKEQMCVYAITHLDTGKVYVGQTTGAAWKRWSAHCSAGSGTGRSAIKLAILKYGRAAFSFEVVDLAETREQLNHKEEFWIRHMNALSPIGYNLKSGGDSAVMSDEAKEKMRKSAIGRRLSDAAKAKISEASKGRQHTADSRQRLRAKALGRKHSDATKQKISARKKGVLPTQEQRERQAAAQLYGKTIRCSNGKTYTSNSAAARDTGASSNGIGNVLHGRRKTANGLTFWFEG